MLGPSQPGDSVSHAPGPVDDVEVVKVGLAPDGAVTSVVIEQTLTINGVGDFELKVLGPVTDVDAPEEQSPQPGLRRSTVTWHGFSPGTKVLRSTLTMDAAGESVRLPIAVGSTPSGTTLRNQTLLPATVDVGPADVGPLVAAVRARLAAGQDPLTGLPATVPATGPVAGQGVLVAVPVRVTGTVGGSPVDTVVGDQPVTVPSTGEVRLRVTAALPSPDALAPDAGVVDLQRVLMQAVRKADVDVFVGVTAPGPSSAVYEYGPAPAPPPPPPPPEERKASAVAIGAAVAGVLALAAAGRAVWLRS